MLFGDWGFESSRLKGANAGGEAALFRPLFILLEAKEVEEIPCNRCLKKRLRCLSLGLFCPGSGWDLGQMPLMTSLLGPGLLVSPLCAPCCSTVGTLSHIWYQDAGSTLGGEGQVSPLPLGLWETLQDIWETGESEL